MKAFGIEIRKANSIDGLYSDVDRVLSNAGIERNGVNKSVQVQTVAHALQKMMKADRWFDLCAIKDCINVCQVHIPYERLAIYSAAHCIHWNEMETEYRQVLMAMVLDDFRELLNPMA